MITTSSCVGTPPISPKPIQWISELTASRHELDLIVERFGSPVHLHNTDSFVANAEQLKRTVAAHNIDFGIYFARKANKALCYLEAAINNEIGIDIASANELDQALSVGVKPSDMVVTSAIKPDDLLQTCLDREVLVVLDNFSEAMRYADMAEQSERTPTVAVRLSNFAQNPEAAHPSRFGFDVSHEESMLQIRAVADRLTLAGLHFHLDGYDAQDRVDALAQSIKIHDRLTEVGSPLQFIDIGGGFPTTYTDEPEEWQRFWTALQRSLLEQDEPITYRNYGYGQIVHEGTVLGPRHAYPHYQAPTGGAWLDSILNTAENGAPSIGEQLRRRNLELRCEPGRSLLDGCGATLATVIHTKMLGSDVLVALDMNSSNCRTQKSELLTDPMHLPLTIGRGDAMSGYLTGAYCSESDLITYRKLRFDQRPSPGDLIIFPNTAGYLMHFTESRSHQYDLPLNVRMDADGGGWLLDPIDRENAYAIG